LQKYTGTQKQLEGGEVQMPITKTFWSQCFGMLTDQFGVAWMITVHAEHQP
jgi:PhnB protein